MGTDIHLAVEVKRSGAWGPSKMVANKYADYDDDPPMVPECPYDSRNYDVFAILANVRNGRGFAGCDTGDGFVPIAMPRGFPSDMHEDTKLCADGYHDETWLTLNELQDHDWDQVCCKRGLVQADIYKEWKASGETFPSSWCGDTNAPQMSEKEFAEAEEAVGTLPVKPDYDPERTYIRSEWPVTHRQAAKNFLNSVIPYMESFLPEVGGDTNKIRLIFNFDS